MTPAVVLIIDDEDIVRKMIIKALEPEGFGICEAENGEAGLAAFDELRPDIVVLDLRMPQMDGFEFLEAVNKPVRDWPHEIIVLTAHGDNNDIEHCYSLGVSRFLRKPCSLIEVRETVKHCFRSLQWRELELREKDLLEERVLERTAELDQRNQRLSQEVEERRRLERNLRAAKELAERALEARSAFLSNISHEMLTPLNAISGFTDVLLESALDDEQRDNLEIVRDRADELLGIIRRLLCLTEAESGKLRLSPRPTNIRDLAFSWISKAKPQLAEKNLAVRWEVATAVPAAIMADPEALGIIVTNLLSNAVKFTDSGEVSLTVELPEADEIESLDSSKVSPNSIPLKFMVSDTGPGIAASRQAELFEEFAMADSSLSRQHGGSGIGLTIAKHLAKALGGVVKVNSAPGKGSDFCFMAWFELCD